MILAMVSALIIGVFVEHPSDAVLSRHTKEIAKDAASYGYVASWDPRRADTLQVDITASRVGMGRAGYSKIDSNYYWAFFRARLESGYSVYRSSSCTVEVTFHGLTVSRRNGLFSECFAD